MSEIGKNLIVISGPSGCGKDTVVKYILSHDDRFALSVSATTRAKDLMKLTEWIIFSCQLPSLYQKYQRVNFWNTPFTATTTTAPLKAK